MDVRPTKPSTLLVDEYFARQNEHFLEQLREVQSPKYLAGLADRWKRDPRPWARQQILSYLDLPLDRPGHHPLVKRLFKHAEGEHDDELMAHFLVAFDRLIRRQRRMRYRWDFQTRQSWREEELCTPRDQILAARQPRYYRDPFTGQKSEMPINNRPRKNGHLFSYATRQYLRRRVWRYYRWLGFGRPAEYPVAIAHALALYRDDDLARGENILDCWCLLNIAFRNSNVLKFSPIRVDLADDRSLGELGAAPRFAELWKKHESAAVLLNLVNRARSRLVRVWAIELLKRYHMASLQEVSVDQLIGLLNHADDEVQQFGAALVESLTGIDSWPVGTWLRLLETRNIAALTIICAAMQKRVRPERLSFVQCVSITCARITPVAQMGLGWLRNRPVVNDADREILARSADAQCEAIGADVAEYALAQLGTPNAYQTDYAIRFFDSLNPEVRRGAWEWLTPQSPGYSDANLWCRLFESPFDDVRLRLVTELGQRASKSDGPRALMQQDLTVVWSAVLLGVHRGGRAKIQALRQVSNAIAAEPQRAEALLPVLAVAIRSVRPAESRVGLSAILTAVAARPELEAQLQTSIPELRLLPAGGER